MTDTDSLSRHRFLSNGGAVGDQHGSTIAVARDNARQHVGNVIHNYFGSPQRDEYQRRWLEVIEWLIPLKAVTDFQTLIYTESRKKHDPETGLWFTRGNALNRWISREEPLRWLCGSGKVLSRLVQCLRRTYCLLPLVGCGKTVLFSTAVEETRRKCRVDQGSRFGYFYCSSRDTSGQDLEVLLRLLLVQLSPPSQISEPLQSLFNLCNDVYPPKTPTFSELKDCLRNVVKLYAEKTDVYLLIDALDEIPLESRDDVFDILDAIADQQLSHLHLLVTSRDHADIRQALTKPLDWSEVIVEEHLVQADIGRYVSNTIEGDRRLRSLNSNMKQEILQRVAVEGGGM
jgi:ankyrin repeat domain-containing protein 50